MSHCGLSVHAKINIMENSKLDYWIMYVDGDLSLEELLKLLADYC